MTHKGQEGGSRRGRGEEGTRDPASVTTEKHVPPQTFVLTHGMLMMSHFPPLLIKNSGGGGGGGAARGTAPFKKHSNESLMKGLGS